MRSDLRPSGAYQTLIKRPLDAVSASALLVIVSPLLGILALAVRKDLGQPVIFKQQRTGYKCQPFYMLKFRTMSDDRDEEGRLLPDEDRVTRFGKFLRRTSLDELPELLNVLRGKMSLVGPRPWFAHYLDRFSPHELERFNVRPGISGWAQVHGRNAIDWDEKLALDLWYVRNVGFLTDCKVLFKTFSILLNGQKSRETETASVTEFRSQDEPELQ